MKPQRMRTPANLEALALGFVVQVQGSWTEAAVKGWRAELTRLGPVSYTHLTLPTILLV